MQNVVNLQVKPEPFGLVLALIGHKLLCNNFAELLLGKLPDLRILLWRTDCAHGIRHMTCDSYIKARIGAQRLKDTDIMKMPRKFG